MNHAGASRYSRGSIGIACGLLCEAAAALPFVAPEVIWISAEHSLVVHLAASLLAGGGAASLFAGSRGFRQWAVPTVLFSLIAFVLPLVGIVAVLVLALILVSHHARVAPAEVALVEIPGRSATRPERAPIHTAGTLPMPLVSLLHDLAPATLQQVVLGLDSLPPADTRPILHRLQKHSDVRVQLYANGLLNDQLDQLERRLAVLKQRAGEGRADENLQNAIIETYSYLFENHLIAPDEVGQVAGQALEEAAAALELNPANPVALRARTEFHLLRGELREAGRCIEHLRPLPGQQQKAFALHARLRFEEAAAQEIVHPTQPGPSTEQQNRSREN